MDIRSRAIIYTILIFLSYVGIMSIFAMFPFIFLLTFVITGSMIAMYFIFLGIYDYLSAKDSKKKETL